MFVYAYNMDKDQVTFNEQLLQKKITGNSPYSFLQLASLKLLLTSFVIATYCSNISSLREFYSEVFNHAVLLLYHYVVLFELDVMHVKLF